MRRTPLLVLALLSVAPGALRAQSSAAERLLVTVPDSRLWAARVAGLPAVAHAASPAPAPSQQVRPTSPLRLAGVGLLAAAGSFMAGVYLGGGIENEFFPCTCDDPGLRGALRGAFILPQVAIPLAVHLADEGNSSLLHTFTGSLIGGAAAVAVGVATQSLEIGFFGAPIGALVGSVIAASR